jgi:hypothetical protein
LPLALAGLCLGAAARPGTAADDTFAFVQVSTPEQRLRYLAEARIWSDPGPLTPDDLLRGPDVPLPAALRGLRPDDEVPCRFLKAGRSLGGKTSKFVCRTADGETMRLKYTDASEKGNREVFALVAATRLMWALGFGADPVFPVTVRCEDCPADPMSGEGPRASRRLLAVFQPRFDDAVMVDGADPNQGWRWSEVDEAIEALPPGDLRDRQRMHFDALSLAGVLLQHGDRKPEQQRLSCGVAITSSAGDVHPVSLEDGHGYQAPVFVEHGDERACAAPVITVQDLGATFGGAGRTSDHLTSKIHLPSWTSKPVFQQAGRGADGQVAECHGALTVSMAAGHGARANPRIGEPGRRFLLDRLEQLTDAHLESLFRAARVESLPERHVWRDPRTGMTRTGTAAWVAAFREKVQEIAGRRCAP